MLPVRRELCHPELHAHLLSACCYLLHSSLDASLLEKCPQELMASRRGGTLKGVPVSRRFVFSDWVQQFCSLHEWWVLSELWLIPQHELLMPQENPVCD